MVTLDEALKMVLSHVLPAGREMVKLTDALNRVLALDIIMDTDVPSANKTAVDGYACRAVDIHEPMKVLEIIPAGKPPSIPVGKGECSKIMTGAMVPEGADMVIMVEDTEEVTPGYIRFTKSYSSKNIRYKGEDLTTGDFVLKAGTRLNPVHLGILASAGLKEVLVAGKPEAAVMSTGDEVIEPGETLQPWQVRNSNAYQLCGQILAAGGRPSYLGISRDDAGEIRNTIQNALGQYDLLFLTGGVSMGDFDLVPGILKELGVHILFDSIAVQPGRPTLFGIRDKTYIFALPGNPVSAFIQFELLAKPLIYKMMGADFQPAMIKLKMACDYTRKKARRLALLPVEINANSEIVPLEYHGSAHLNAYSRAFGIIRIPEGTEHISKGDWLDVRSL